MPNTARIEIAVIGIDIGKNSFHVVGHDKRGSIVLRQVKVYWMTLNSDRSSGLDRELHRTLLPWS